MPLIECAAARPPYSSEVSQAERFQGVPVVLEPIPQRSIAVANEYVSLLSRDQLQLTTSCKSFFPIKISCEVE